MNAACRKGILATVNCSCTLIEYKNCRFHILSLRQKPALERGAKNAAENVAFEIERAESRSTFSAIYFTSFLSNDIKIETCSVNNTERCLNLTSTSMKYGS